MTIESRRTPDARFVGLPDYPFEPHYLAIDAGDGEGTKLRVHYVDEWPGEDASGETVLLLHGEPTWSYLYRHVIPPLVAAGHRCVAPDLVGFGKSDKPRNRFDYTYQAHVEWLSETVFDQLDLHDVTMVCHDWGGLLGLRLLADHPDRFSRVVATSTSLPTGDQDLGSTLSVWLQLSQRANPFSAGAVVERGAVTKLDPAVKAAYDAPFPDESYLQGARQFPLLVPLTPYDEASEPNRRAWSALRTLAVPLLYAHAEHDWGVGDGRAALRDGVPGAREVIIEQAGHFVQEDRSAEVAEVIEGFIRDTARG
ncbi:haloalkane dehalogenase [Kribbella sp. NPDC003505]|uniref:haloalkane dehalogenase n=1 Tax=Kribbella sp. NPDC003505 TaxID=3154448 RepID=UPI0033A8A341